MNTAEKFGVFGVQARARRYDAMHVRPRAPAQTDGEDAIPLRTRRPVGKSPPMRSAEMQSTAGSGGAYRVRQAAQRAQARAEAQRSAAGYAETNAPGRRRRGRTVPEDRRRWRADPDSAHNTDAIFDAQDRPEAYRLARKRMLTHRGKLSLLIAALMVLLIAFVALPVYKLIFVVEEIRVEGSTVYSDEEIMTASGVVPGINLYSFSSRTAEENLTLRCPYIRTLDVNRTMPDAVHFTVSEDTAVFCAEIYGEMWALSGTLRVLERTDPASASADGLIRLLLPEVQRALGGRVLDFGDERSTMRIREILETVQKSAICPSITCVDLRNLRELHMVSRGVYLLDFGGADDVALKLRVAYAVLADPLFDGTIKAELDLTASGSTSVVFDDQLDFEGLD